MSAKKPKPIRLTKQRALALLEAATRGTDEWAEFIRANLETTDLDTMRAAQEQDRDRALALDAMAIVRHRYVGGEAPTEPTPTLF